MSNRFPMLASRELQIEMNELMEMVIRAGSVRHQLTLPFEGNEELVDKIMKSTVELTPIEIGGVRGIVEGAQVTVGGEVEVWLIECEEDK